MSKTPPGNYEFSNDAFKDNQHNPPLHKATLPVSEDELDSELENEELLESIAIVGMAGRFPGANNIQEFWDNLCDGVESITEFSEEELKSKGVSDSLLHHPNFVRTGALLDDIDRFDANFFGYSPREAELMDPQHRLFMECAWEALEHSGYDPKRFDGWIGVYGGASPSSYFMYHLFPYLQQHPELQNPTIFLGIDKDYLTTQVSNRLNLKGPSVCVQTACSTAMVAILHGCQSLNNYQSDMVLAGGVSINVQQDKGYIHEGEGFLSSDGHCHAFDAKAQGLVEGNGVGLVVLKRLEDALADRDTIHAVIKSSAINNDGSEKMSYSAPSVNGQSEVVALAIAKAGIPADTISYVETHGTGTKLGDPVEIRALTQAFRNSTRKTGFCAVGSVKPNIGHLGTAAGISSVIKAALSLKHQKIPPTVNFQTPNPHIDFENSPFYVNTNLADWKANGVPRRAGVSSFGIGGTNAHLILEEFIPENDSGTTRPCQLLMLSAKTETALEAATHNLARHLQTDRDQLSTDTSFADMAYTLQVGRRAFPHRRIVIARHAEAALHALESRDPEKLSTRYCDNEIPASLVFLFPPIGDQYVEMALALYQHEPHFREIVDQVFRLFRKHHHQDLQTVLFPQSGNALSTASASPTKRLEQTPVAYPVLFVIEYAMARLLMYWGVVPQAMLGAGLGEYVTACVAGVWSLEDTVSIVAERAKLIQESAVRDPQEKLAALLNTLSFHTPEISFISSVTGTWITVEQATNPQYWIRHAQVSEPTSSQDLTKCAAGLEMLLTDPNRIFLEVGPGNPLLDLAKAQPSFGASHQLLGTLPPHASDETEHAYLLNSLGHLWMSGVEINWTRFYENESRFRVPLPTYPFERQRFWIQPLPAHQESSIAEVSPEALYAAKHTKRNLTANSLEEQMKAIWEEVLGLPNVGIDDNFFELGGNSMLALQIKAKTQNDLGLEVPLSAMVRSQTIAQLVSNLSRPQNEETVRPPLVALHPEGGLPPLFFVPGGSGSPTAYGHLTRHLGQDQPFYSFQSRGIENDLELFSSIEAIAKDYREAMQALVPHGPYYLGGWSLGGVVALEMAQQLKSQGETVALLMLLDAQAPTAPRWPFQALTTAQTTFTTLFHFYNLKPPTSYEELKELSQVVGFPLPENSQALLDIDWNNWPTQADHIWKQLQPYVNVYKANLQAGLKYKAQHYDGNTLLIRSNRKVLRMFEDPLTKDWRHWITGKLTIEEVTGSHFSMLDPENAPEVADILQMALTETMQ